MLLVRIFKVEQNFSYDKNELSTVSIVHLLVGCDFYCLNLWGIHGLKDSSFPQLSVVRIDVFGILMLLDTQNKQVFNS